MSVLGRFYQAFSQRDPGTMGACYHAGARFSDPVFPRLDAAQVKAMWGMLLSAATDLQVDFRVLQEDAAGGKVRWNARYSYGPKGRRVYNVVTSTFQIKDGLIVGQQDCFDLWRWTRQALGLRGVLLGWSPLMHGQVRALAAKRLAKAMRKAAATGPPPPMP